MKLLFSFLLLFSIGCTTVPKYDFTSDKIIYIRQIKKDEISEIYVKGFQKDEIIPELTKIIDKQEDHQYDGVLSKVTEIRKELDKNIHKMKKENKNDQKRNN